MLDYGAVGDGIADDSAAIQAAIDANKGGTVLLPAGHTFLAAGIALVGSSYDGTGVVVEGSFLLAPSEGGNNWNSPASPAFVGIVLQDVEDIFIDVPGVMDGNRTHQADSQQIHLLVLAGARSIRIDRFNAREVRGDGIMITSETNISPLTVNSNGIVIGQMLVINSVDDGRNALSIISGENILIGGGVSIRVGGDDLGLLNERMPGGFDIEPDGDWHLVRNVRSGPWLVETIGTSGIAVLGKALTSDSARDWNVEDVSIAPSMVVHTGAAVGGPLFMRCRRLTADVTLTRSTPNAGVEIDYADFCDLRVRTAGCSNSVTVGYSNSVHDSAIHVEIGGYSIYGLAVVGADRCRFMGYVRGPTTGNAYGVMMTAASRGTVTQTGNVYSVDVPYAANNTFGFYTGAGLTLTECVVADCAFTGYSGHAVQFGFNTFLPTRHVQGRNFGAGVPSNGYWTLGDFVRNVNPSIVSGKALLGWSRLTSGSGHIGGIDWTPLYATVS